MKFLDACVKLVEYKNKKYTNGTITIMWKDENTCFMYNEYPKDVPKRKFSPYDISCYCKGNWIEGLEPPKDNTYVCPSCGDTHDEYAKVCKLCTTKMLEDKRTVSRHIAYPPYDNIPYKCPVCMGSGIVPRDWNAYPYSNDPILDTNNVCRACDGKGIVWK